MLALLALFGAANCRNSWLAAALATAPAPAPATALAPATLPVPGSGAALPVLEFCLEELLDGMVETLGFLEQTELMGVDRLDLAADLSLSGGGNCTLVMFATGVMNPFSRLDFGEALLLPLVPSPLPAIGFGTTGDGAEDVLEAPTCCWSWCCRLFSWTLEGLALMEPRCDRSVWSGTVNDTVVNLLTELDELMGVMRDAEGVVVVVKGDCSSFTAFEELFMALVTDELNPDSIDATGCSSWVFSLSPLGFW